MRRTNCPNCAAPIRGETCQYCGTTFVDFASIDCTRPFYVRMRLDDGSTLEFKAMMQGTQLSLSTHELAKVTTEFVVLDFLDRV